jgi:glycosyltransferase involved in cell wall biosynthesis
VVPLDAEESYDRLRAEGIEVTRMPLVRFRKTRSMGFWVRFPKRYVADVVRLVHHLNGGQIDLVEGSSVNLQAAWAGRLAGAGVVWRIGDISAPGLLRLAVAMLLPFLADSVMVNGRSLIGYYPGLLRLGPRLFVYYPPVDVERIARATEGRAVGRSERLVVGTIANVNPDKGLEFLVESAGRLATRADLEFVVVGAESSVHGAYARRLRERVDRLGLSGKFRFVGGTADIVPWLRSMDIFVISSVREGSSATAIEAMAAGLPVIASDVGSISEVVIDGETGRLVTAGDAVALADAIGDMTDNRERIRRLGDAGRRRAREEFNLERMLAVHEAACRAAMLRRGHRRRSRLSRGSD